MNEYLKYLKNPGILSAIGAIIYYLIERFDCYINARKTSSLNRRTLVVFFILLVCLFYISIKDNTSSQEIFTDIGNF
jgi:phosphoglycerol transferase MdoB-like AlkP superfamily enzyme